MLAPRRRHVLDAGGVYDESGRGSATRPRTLRAAPSAGGRAEFDARRVLACASGEAGRAGQRRRGRRGRRASGTASLLLDARRRARSTPLLTWRDSRAAAEAERARAHGSTPTPCTRRTGCPLHAELLAGEARRGSRAEHGTLAARASSRFATTSYAGCSASRATSLSMASATGLLDLARSRWDEELLDALGLDAEQLPRALRRAAGARRRGSRGRRRGVLEPRRGLRRRATRAALMIGTSGACASSTRPSRRCRGRASSSTGSTRGGWSRAAPSPTAATCYGWLERTLDCRGEPEARRPARRRTGSTFLALLGGEREPGWKPRGARRDRRAHVRDDAGRHPPGRARGRRLRFAEIADRAPGGATRSSPPAVRCSQNRGVGADPRRRARRGRSPLSAVEEASARGAAVLALERLGVDADPAPLGETFEPRAGRGRRATRPRAERQRALYDARDLRRRADAARARGSGDVRRRRCPPRRAAPPACPEPRQLAHRELHHARPARPRLGERRRAPRRRSRPRASGPRR